MCIIFPYIGLRGQRRRICTALAGAMRPQESTLSILIGDFNFVRDLEDRVNLVTGERPLGGDAAEHEEWREQLLGPKGFHEAWQEECTHRTTLHVEA